jgi:hypothetical protein
LAGASRGKLVYVEGFACGVIPVPHAWCADQNGNVVDPTWCGAGSLYAKLGTEYHGVAFDIEFVRECKTKSGIFGVLENWKLDFSLFKSKPDLSCLVPSTFFLS